MMPFGMPYGAAPPVDPYAAAGSGAGTLPSGERKVNKRGIPKGATGPATVYLPAPLFRLFTPKAPIVWKPKPGRGARARALARNPISGLGALLGKGNSLFDDYRSVTKASIPAKDPAAEKKEKKEKEKAEKKRAHESKVAEALKAWDPNRAAGAETRTADAYKTLFVGRLSYAVTAQKLRDHMSQYGVIKDVKMVADRSGKPRGYAFVQFELESDMRIAYRRMDGSNIDGRKVVVDVERGRTVKSWKPRRLGGGLGGTRRGHPSVNQRFAGRDVIKRMYTGKNALAPSGDSRGGLGFRGERDRGPPSSSFSRRRDYGDRRGRDYGEGRRRDYRDDGRRDHGRRQEQRWEDRRDDRRDGRFHRQNSSSSRRDDRREGRDRGGGGGRFQRHNSSRRDGGGRRDNNSGAWARDRGAHNRNSNYDSRGDQRGYYRGDRY